MLPKDRWRCAAFPHSKGIKKVPKLPASCREACCFNPRSLSSRYLCGVVLHDPVSKHITSPLSRKSAPSGQGPGIAQKPKGKPVCSRLEMASADVLPPLLAPTFQPVEPQGPSPKRKRPEDKTSRLLIDGAHLEPPQKIDFDPAKHLSFVPPSKTYSMKEIGLEDRGISPTAVSEPFQLFSPEAIKQMRAEVLSKDVLSNCKYSSNLAQCQLRGFAPESVPCPSG